MDIARVQRSYDRQLRPDDELDEFEFLAEVRALMAKDGECYPWSHENFLEAIEQQESLDGLLESCRLALSTPIGGALYSIVYGYWKKVAEDLAPQRLAAARGWSR